MKNFRKIFSQLYDEYVDKIYRFIFLKVNSQEIAEDLTSDTFLRCWESFRDRNDEVENPKAFLYQIARNLITNHYREKGRTNIVSADYVPIFDPSPSLEEKACFNSDLELTRTALANLKEEYQNVLVWYYIDEFKIPEIAEMAQKSEGAVRVTIHRALNALKEELNNKQPNNKHKEA